MLFSKNVKYHIVFLCFFSFPLRMVYSTELGANQNSLLCKVCHHSKIFSSCTSLRPFGFYDEERLITSILFVVATSTFNSSLSFSSPFFLLLFVCFNEPTNNKFLLKCVFFLLSVFCQACCGLSLWCY